MANLLDNRSHIMMSCTFLTLKRFLCSYKVCVSGLALCTRQRDPSRTLRPRLSSPLGDGSTVHVAHAGHSQTQRRQFTRHQQPGGGQDDEISGTGLSRDHFKNYTPLSWYGLCWAQHNLTVVSGIYDVVLSESWQ